jgi:hypothetical protein
MKEIDSNKVQEFDFDWVMKYLGITNKEIIKRYKI